MSSRRLVLLILAIVTAVSTVTTITSAAATQMGVNEIRPGMVGVGRTVFDGTQVEEFKVNILGVLEK